jgi:hypothetical protein
MINASILLLRPVIFPYIHGLPSTRSPILLPLHPTLSLFLPANTLPFFPSSFRIYFPRLPLPILFHTTPSKAYTTPDEPSS